MHLRARAFSKYAKMRRIIISDRPGAWFVGVGRRDNTCIFTPLLVCRPLQQCIIFVLPLVFAIHLYSETTHTAVRRPHLVSLVGPVTTGIHEGPVFVS